MRVSVERVGASGHRRSYHDVVRARVVAQEDAVEREQRHVGRRVLRAGKGAKPLGRAGVERERHHDPGRGPLFGSRAVAAERGLGRGALETLRPVRHLVGQLTALDAGALPLGPVCILDLHRRQLGGAARRRRAVEPREVAQKHLDGPRVGHDVMHGGVQEPVAFAEAEERRAGQRRPREIEGLARVRRDALAQRGALLCLRDAAQVHLGQVHVCSLVEALRGLPVGVVEARAQDLVPREQPVERGRERRHVEIAAEPEARRHVELRGPRRELLAEPQPPLRERERRAGHALARDRAGRAHSPAA